MSIRRTCMSRSLMLAVAAVFCWLGATACPGNGSGVLTAPGDEKKEPSLNPPFTADGLIMKLGDNRAVVFPGVTSAEKAQTKSVQKGEGPVTSTISYDQFAVGLGLTDKSAFFEVYGITPYGESVIGTSDAVYLWAPGHDKPVKILNKLAYQKGTSSFSYLKDKDALLFTVPGQGLMMRQMDGTTVLIHTDPKDTFIQARWLPFPELPLMVTSGNMIALNRQSFQEVSLPFGMPKDSKPSSGFLYYLGDLGAGNFFAPNPLASMPDKLFSLDGTKSWDIAAPTPDNFVGLLPDPADFFDSLYKGGRYFSDTSELVYPGCGGLCILDMSQPGTKPKSIVAPKISSMSPTSEKVVAKGKFSGTGVDEYLVMTSSGGVYAVDSATGGVKNFTPSIPISHVIAFDDSKHRMLGSGLVAGDTSLYLIDTTTWKILETKNVKLGAVSNYSGGPFTRPYYTVHGDPVDGKVSVGLVGGNEGLGLSVDKITPLELGTILYEPSSLYGVKVFSIKDTGGKRTTPVVADATPDAQPPPKAPACVANCVGKPCGDDGCGGSCGNCEGGQLCNIDFQCVVKGSAPKISEVPSFPILTVLKDTVELVKQPTMIESSVGLATISMECGGGALIIADTAYDPEFHKNAYSFKLQISNVTEATVCQIKAKDTLGQETSKSFQVMLEE